MMDNPRLVPHVRSRDQAEGGGRNGGKTRGGGGERAERKKDSREKSVRDDERDSGVGHSARVFRSIPPFRLALRSVPVGTPRTPVFPPLWVRTLLSARPAEARPNPSTSSVHPCISSGGRGSERERERETRRKRRKGARRRRRERRIDG